ncbi:MAG: M23 family metallopeptidase [Bacilli bacterium]|nr:M23 family metallopeptidase [Bacilli bacterium]
MGLDAKNRIRKRRYNLLKNEAYKTNKDYYKENKNKGLSFLSSLCLLVCIALSVLIYGKNDENGKWLKDNFGIEVSFSKINQTMSKYTDYILDFDIFKFLEDDKPVSYESYYYSLGNNLYESTSNEITSIGDGTVVFVGEVDNKKVLIIEHDLGYSATYIGLEDVLVKKYDRVDDKNTIGVSFEPIEIHFKKESVSISYEEVLALFS